MIDVEKWKSCPWLRPLRRAVYRLRRYRDRRPKALILMYHRILPDPEEDILGTHVRLSFFKAQLELLSRRFVVVGLGDLLRQLREGELRRDLIAISFDDGYRDNHVYALPALERARLPAAFFIPTDFVGREETLPDETLRRILDHRAVDELRLPGGERVSIGTRRARHLAAHRALAHLSALPQEGRKNVLASLAREIATSIPQAREIDLPLDWSEIVELERRGMAVASHGASHRSLAAVPREDLERELNGSRRALEERLGAPVRFFSYPYGRPWNLSPEVIIGVKQAGYTLGLTASAGPVLSDQSPFLLRRLAAPDAAPRELLLRIEQTLAARAPSEEIAL